MLLAAAAVFAFALALYARTLAPGVGFVDSGELILTARTLGVAHPPGFPFYLLLAHAASWLPVSEPAVGVHLLSALCASLAAALVTLVVGAALRQIDAVADTFAVLWAAALAGLLFACSRTLWSFATVAEVYALHTALTALLLLSLLLWRRGGGAGWLPVAALTAGLAAGVHVLTLVVVLPGLAALLRVPAGRRLRLRQVLAAASLALATAAIVYAYLPLAAARLPLWSWGDPRTPQRFFDHVSARQYRSYAELSAATVASEGAELARLACQQLGPVATPVALALVLGGSLALWRRDRAQLVALAGMVAGPAAWGLVYPIAEDKPAYYLPIFLAAVVVTGHGAEAGLRWAGGRAARRWAAAALLLLVPVPALLANFPFADRSGDFLAADYVANVTGAMAPGGMLLTMDWQLYSPLLYTRHVKGERPDLVVIDLKLLRRAWYFDYLSAAYPRLLYGAPGRAGAYLASLDRWSADPRAFAADEPAVRAINEQLASLLVDLVERHARMAPVYLTRDVALNRVGPEGELIRRLLAGGRRLVPHGLVYLLAPDAAFQPPPALGLRTRGLVDGTLRFDAEDVVLQKVLPVYTGMLVAEGHYLAAHGRRALAVARFRQALELSPGYRPALVALAER